MRSLAPALLIALAAPTVAGAQVEEEVRRTEKGVVLFSYAARPDVEVCDQGIRIGDEHLWWSVRDRDEGASDCRVGLLEVQLWVRGGEVHDVDVVHGDRDRPDGAVDLGEIEAGRAARYLLEVAKHGDRGRGIQEAILPAALAAVDGVWRDLLVIAKEPDVAADVRKNALFWLGQEAAAAATDGLADVALDGAEDQEIRDAAVFALAQRPESEGVPILMELAREGRESETRRKAMFWLAQSDDARVLDFFERILVRRAGG